MVLYGIITELSIVRLFVAGLLPGILSGRDQVQTEALGVLVDRVDEVLGGVLQVAELAVAAHGAGHVKHQRDFDVADGFLGHRVDQRAKVGDAHHVEKVGRHVDVCVDLDVFVVDRLCHADIVDEPSHTGLGEIVEHKDFGVDFLRQRGGGQLAIESAFGGTLRGAIGLHQEQCP